MSGAPRARARLAHHPRDEKHEEERGDRKRADLLDAGRQQQEARGSGNHRKDEERKTEHGFSPTVFKSVLTPAKCMPSCSNDRRLLPAAWWCSSTLRTYSRTTRGAIRTCASSPSGCRRNTTTARACAASRCSTT